MPLTQECKEWINENITVSSNQWLGSSFMYSRDFADELIEAMIDDDLIEGQDFQVISK
jgi:predicted nucleic-acid-binding protein